LGRLILVTGGARSGKSRFAVDLAKRLGERVAFIATCVPRDEEMRKRVEEHKKNRPDSWKTIEEETDVTSVLQSLPEDCEVAIVDCLTLLVSNLLLTGESEQEISRQVREIAASTLKSHLTAIVVSNEVGSGIVPDSEIGRRFRDIAGLANQILARGAAEVYLLVSGIPLKIKGE
jgi:adenosylcobinamide kinase/adenosylcobinamide-phosphate guanylyltransferase